MTPDSASYYHAAYVAAAAIYGLYGASLWWRWRKVRDRRTQRESSSRRPVSLQ